MSAVRTSDQRRPQLTASDKIGRAVDGLIGIFNPRAQMRRLAFRNAAGIMGASGAYKGARSNRTNNNWVTSMGSADEDLLNDLAKLRERSRDLNRNDAFASGVTRTITTNTVGTGIRPQSSIEAKSLKIDETKASELKTACERVWEKWQFTADAGNRMDFYELQRLADRQILESGEALFLVVMVEDANRKYSLALDPIEPDRLETPPGKNENADIRKGVELGKRGEPIAYWIKKTHPGDYSYKASGQKRDDYVRVPAFNKFGRPNVIHIFDVERPGQTRGIPYFAPVMDYFKNTADYMEAEQVAARVSACIALVVETENAADAASFSSDQTTANGNRLESIAPGMVKYLETGEKISAFNPSRPAAPFDAFVMRMLRAISTGLNLPYEIVAKDFSQTNYSSARAALLQAYRYFKQRQIKLSTKLCQPIWKLLMEEAWLRGELEFENFYENEFEYTRATWVTPGWQWVDPKKEAEAAVLSIDEGLSNLSNECASRGEDYETIMRTRARELKLRKDLEAEFGVTFDTKKPAKPASQENTAPESEPGKEPEEAS